MDVGFALSGIPTITINLFNRLLYIQFVCIALMELLSCNKQTFNCSVLVHMTIKHSTWQAHKQKQGKARQEKKDLTEQRKPQLFHTE